jgi:hypothetical protein
MTQITPKETIVERAKVFSAICFNILRNDKKHETLLCQTRFDTGVFPVDVVISVLSSLRFDTGVFRVGVISVLNSLTFDRGVFHCLSKSVKL